MRRALLLVLAIALAPPAFAQTQTETKIDDLYVDFSVPDVPALALFGLNPNKVARPGDLKELSVSVLPLAAGAEQIGSGVAISWAPVYTFARSVSGYKSGVARRLEFSVATSKDAKSDAITLGTGARVILLDRSDPLLNDAFNTAILKILERSLKGPEARDAFWNTQASPVLNDIVARMTREPVAQAELKDGFLDSWDIMSVPPGTTPALQFLRFQRVINRAADPDKNITPVDLSSDPTLKARVEQLAQAFVEAEKPPAATSKAALVAEREKFMEAHWNAPVVSVDVGELSRSSSGTWGDLAAQQLGTAFLATLPAGKSGEIVIQVQARKGLGDAPEEERFYSGGGRLLLGNATKRFSVEGLVSDARTLDPTTNGTTKRLTLGTEFRVSKGFWLEVAVGNVWNPGDAGHGADLLSLASLKYAFKTKTRFTEVPGVTDEEDN